MSLAPNEVVLAAPRGFCAGVERAIEIVERVLELHGAPVYVRHEVVHNRFVVESLRQKGAVFVEELDEVPDGATVVFSAHGVAQSVRAEAQRRRLTVFDATCPLVTKVHLQVVRLSQSGYEIIMVGHRGHPEVDGTVGQIPAGIHVIESVDDVAHLAVPADRPLAYVTQTTLSMDDAGNIIAALRARFPDIVGPRKDDICYATQNRQDAVKALAREVDAVLVVGSRNSSNSNRLREVAQLRGVPAYLVDDAEGIDPAWLEGRRRVGITAGASAPEVLVSQVVARVQALGAATVRELQGVSENVVFALPKSLQVVPIKDVAR